MSGGLMAKRIAKTKSKANQDESVVSIKDQDLIILQATPQVSLSALEDAVFQGFSTGRNLHKKGQDWLAFSASDRSHWAGKTLWIGFSESVALELIDGLQAYLENEGVPVDREMGMAVHNDLRPFARLANEGPELLVPQALVGAPGRKLSRGGVELSARGYLIER